MSGAFAAWQPEYAARGIATFPVRDKKPAVAGYLKIGCGGSSQLAQKPQFANDEAFGFGVKRSGLAVLDVDAPDERLLADALDEFGATPLIIRSGSGNFQAWYRHNGETRRVRPDKSRPIDILGDGFVVAPPSKGARGLYEIVSGSLDDLPRLPVMRAPAALPAPAKAVPQGERTVTLWERCMGKAKSVPSFEALLSWAHDENARCMVPPLPDDDVYRQAKGAWEKTLAGENWIGSGQRLVMDSVKAVDLIKTQPDAFLLFAALKSLHNGHPTFLVANAMAESLNMPRKRFTAARDYLVKIGELKELRPYTRHSPATYSF